MAKANYRKYFLTTLIVALSVSALIGILVFLIGDFGETEMRILMTTLAIGGFSLTGLSGAVIYHRDRLRVFSVAGMLTAVVGFLVTVTGIWDVINLEEIWKLIVILIILSASAAHGSLLFLIRPKTKNIRYFMTATLILITIVALMLINTTLDDFDSGEFYYRLLGVFAILDVLGTVLTPVLNKITEQKQ